MCSSNSHERGEDVAKAASAVEEPGAGSPLALDCPYCMAENAVEPEPQAEGDGPFLVCRQCGVAFQGEAEMEIARQEMKARTPEGLRANHLVRTAGVPVGSVPSHEAAGAAFAPPLVVASVDDVALVVAALQYYGGTAERVLAQAKAIAAACTDKAAFLLAHYTDAMKAVVARETANAKKRSIQVITSQSETPTTVGLRKKPADVKVEDLDAALAWAQKAMQEFPDIDPAIRYVPEQVIEAHEELDVRAFKAWWRQHGGEPAGCVVEPEQDTLTIK